MLKLKLQYFGHLMRRADSFEKTLMAICALGGHHCGWERTASAPRAGKTRAARVGVRVGVGWEVPVVLSAVAIAPRNAQFMRSWVPMDRHPVGGAEGCGPQTQGMVVTKRLPTVLLHSMRTPSRAVEHHSFP